MRSAPGATDTASAACHCITCGDEGTPMRVLELNRLRGAAICSDGAGAQQPIAIDLLESVGVGDEVLVHAGVALTRLGGAG